MAKKPTAAETKNAPATAPSQPWAKSDAAKADSSKPSGDTTNAPAPAEPTKNPQDAAPAGEVPSELRDQLTPTGNPNAAHDAARDAAGGNGGGEVPSEVIDQHTPTGPNPAEVHAAAEARTPESSPNSVDAEAKDAETPTGEDLSSKLHAQFEQLSEDEREEFNSFMNEQAELKLEQLTRGREARAMEVNLVDGAEHFGKSASRRNKQVEA